MPAGNTTTQSLADSLDDVRSSARIVREQQAVMTSSVERRTLGRGIGTKWQEVSMSQLTAQAVSENTVLDNPQQLEDTLFSIEPTVIGIQTLITDRVALRINRQAFARTGVLGQNAIERKKDEDGLTILSGATTVLGTANTALAIGEIRAARYQISSNATEPAPPNAAYMAVLHGFQIVDIENSILAPPTGADVQLGNNFGTQVFRNGFRGMAGGVNVKEDGNITIDANSDATGGVFIREGIVLVQGRSPYMKTREEPHIGGGATSVFHYDEYAYGERSAGNWVFGIISDATAPTA